MKVKTGNNCAVIELESGENGNDSECKVKILVSFSTPVFENMGDKYRKLWDGFTKTTMKHIKNEFPWMEEDMWRQMQVGKWYKIKEA